MSTDAELARPKRHSFVEFPPILTEHQAAAMTGFSVWWFRDHRRLGTGPKYQQIPPRSIRYDRDDLLAWMRQFEVER